MTLKLILDPPQPVAACKGRYFRYIQTAFVGKTKRLVFTKELRPLKSLSCPGCNKCYGVMDDVAEGIHAGPTGFIEFDPGLKSGDTVTLRMVETGRDWESNLLESWIYRAEKVELSDSEACGST